ncbi:SUMO protein smt3 [Tilletia horrida]|uniref:SUMO protein smt3 n=1 Tax=Tilletia horrida TaxID=155126 RepID=A0AAN6GQK4_9BASI|nr:SUMO protein smt3 [Tilletia horrida]KAK0554104.1 SUMO protein smt3 [Tilletia horrida]KAK0568146.1 SUMO protein smt3 [Tilletia horrida]
MSDNEQNQDANTKQEAPEQLNIKVKDAEGNEVFFKVKRHTRLSKLRKAYAERMGKQETQIRFVFDGERITDECTPMSLNMEDNDEIDAMVEQVGGSSSLSRSA